MIIYRMEKSDGGGPFFTRDGHHRLDYNVKSNNNYLYGCKTLQELNEWFLSKFSEYDLDDCHLKIYDIPEEEIII